MSDAKCGDSELLIVGCCVILFPILLGVGLGATFSWNWMWLTWAVTCFAVLLLYKRDVRRRVKAARAAQEPKP